MVLSLLRPKARLLVLDDDTSMQKLMGTLLRREGHRVDVVSGGNQAIERLDEQEYDALLLDLMTPTEGGMTVIRHLREARPAMLRRVLVVTGSPDAVLRTIEGEVFEVVRKPFTPDELTSAIARLLAANEV
ncbi:MAG: response regulator [Acidobacteria bacterium]|nr:response regulator [Acidobacteriota bacterium]MBV9479032.1 response regulator [Acidobacteriota bacterium]